jgi:predicted lipoprotein with Yx(FWY)xxD motif
VAAAVLLACAACAGSAAADHGTPSKGAPASQYVVQMVPYGRGVVMADSRGHMLYAWHGDTAPGTSLCNAKCATIWPPLHAVAGGKFGPGLSPTTFTVIVRKDGTRQLATNGRPLYAYSGDKKADVANGERVQYHFLLDDDGEKVCGASGGVNC